MTRLLCLCALMMIVLSCAASAAPVTQTAAGNVVPKLPGYDLGAESQKWSTLWAERGYVGYIDAATNDSGHPAVSGTSTGPMPGVTGMGNSTGPGVLAIGTSQADALTIRNGSLGGAPYLKTRGRWLPSGDLRTSTSVAAAQIEALTTEDDLIVTTSQDLVLYSGNDLQLKTGGGAIQANGWPIWTQGNDGAGSGLDADTLDAHDSSYFAAASALPAGTIWSSANDGSGSGLDADLLDGHSSAYFAPTTGTVTLSGTNTWTGLNTFTALPTGAGAGQGALYINPATVMGAQTLFGVAVGGSEKLRLDGYGTLNLAGGIAWGDYNIGSTSWAMTAGNIFDDGGAMLLQSNGVADSTVMLKSGDGSTFMAVSDGQIQGNGGRHTFYTAPTGTGVSEAGFQIGTAVTTADYSLLNLYVGVTSKFSVDVEGDVAGHSFTGIGSGLTGLSGSNISSGTVADARLSANVALREGGNTFNDTQTFNGAVYTGAGGAKLYLGSVDGDVAGSLEIVTPNDPIVLVSANTDASSVYFGDAGGASSVHLVGNTLSCDVANGLQIKRAGTTSSEMSLGVDTINAGEVGLYGLSGDQKIAAYVQSAGQFQYGGGDGAGSILCDSQGVMFNSGVAQFVIGNGDTGGEMGIANDGGEMQIVNPFGNGFNFQDNSQDCFYVASDQVRARKPFIMDAQSSAFSPWDNTIVTMGMHGSKFYIGYKDGATVRWKYLDMAGTGTTWVHTTTAP